MKSHLWNAQTICLHPWTLFWLGATELWCSTRSCPIPILAPYCVYDVQSKPLLRHWYPIIVRKGVPAPGFLRHPHLDPVCPLPFKICVPSPLFCSTLMQIPPALIQPTNISSFKQILKGRIYQLNCRFLSKINFNVKPCYKYVTNTISPCTILSPPFFDFPDSLF